jgi:hypothetical protein
MSDVIETASTGRAKCRRCQQKIEKGELRFGEKVENPFGEGEATHWFHLACAAEKRPDKLMAALAEHTDAIADRERLERIASEGIDNPKLTAVERAERAPTARATCQQCREKIGKGELRIAITREAEPMGMAAQSYIHASCGPAHIGAAGLGAKLERTSPELGADDLAELSSLLSSC